MKESIGRASADMKGCYALIYRCEDEAQLGLYPEPLPVKTQDLREPPSDIVDSIRSKVGVLGSTIAFASS